MKSACLVIGGGVIGLSTAYELACRERSVRVIERGRLGREASWAGAGILPPPATRADVPAWRRLQAMSSALHAEWSDRLREETGIDNEYRRCGAVHIARRPGEVAALRAEMLDLAEDGVRIEEIDPRVDLRDLEPNLSHRLPDETQIRAAFHLPDEAQIRNPRHLQALAVACRKLGVVIDEQTSAGSFAIEGDRVVSVTTDAGEIAAESVVLAAGAWSETLLDALGLKLSVYPVRGQMILYRCEKPPVARIINEGPRYIVPRCDGRVLVGSTEEDVGFDRQTTDEGIGELRDFAERLLPPLANWPIENTWAGLRPHAVDGFPYIGRVPHLQNAFVAAGHYRAGLSTSTGTAVLLGQLIVGEALELDISEFRLQR